MNKILLLLCVMITLLLVGCSRNTESTETTAPSQSDGSTPYVLQVPPEDRNQAFLCQNFVETPEGYYFGVDRSAETFIYFCPRGEAAFYPLCGKPNCAHNDRNCNAFAGRVFGYYDGALYGAEMGFTQIDVVKMNLDGTDHQKLTSLDISNAVNNGGFFYVFHHGKLYVWTTPMDENDKSILTVLNLSDCSRMDHTLESAIWYYSNFCGDKLYGIKNLSLSPEEREAWKANPNAGYEREMGEVDAAAGTERTVASVQSPGFLSAYYSDSTMYAYKWEGSDSNGIDPKKLQAGFLEIDLTSGAVKDCGTPVDDIDWIACDEDYIYAHSFFRREDGSCTEDEEEGVQYTLYLLSRDYQLVDQIELASNIGIVAVTSDRIFFIQNYGATISYYLDKAQIGSHELKLLPVETIR